MYLTRNKKNKKNNNKINKQIENADTNTNTNADTKADTNTNTNTNTETVTPDIIQCLICWEPSNEQTKIYKMKHIALFASDCDCDCNFHLHCFFDWVKKTPTCPICREPLNINNEMFDLYTLGPNYKIKLFFKKISICLNKMISMLLKYMSILFLLRISINVINSILSKYTVKN